MVLRRAIACQGYNVSIGMKGRSATGGRPRAFDVEEALDRALHVFWSKGYEGASLSDLTKAMRVNRPSLYAAFGDKEALFRKALDRYASGPAAYTREALKEPTARAIAERLLRGAAELLGDSRHPRGCLMVQGALACGDAGHSIQRELMARRAAGEAALRRRLERAKASGDLPAGSDPAQLAFYLVTVLHGMAVQAAGGAGSPQLRRVVETALRAWP
jgi:AcrR family transcriptional regulator